MKFPKNNYKKIIIGLVLLAIIFIGINRFNTNKNKSELIFDPKKDQIVTVRKETIKDELTLAGSVDAASTADLRFQTSGQLQWIGVKVGDSVKKFQAIASLNKDQLKKQLQTNFNNYRSSRSTFDDTQDQYKDSVLTDEVRRVLLRNQSTLDNSVITYELNDLAIKYATLTTPIEGIVTHIDRPNAGVNITIADSIFIIDPKSIYFKSQIDQEDVVNIKIGDPTEIKIDSYPDKTFTSKIKYISFTPVAGQSSTVYDVHFELPSDNNNLQYRLGMDGDASIILKVSEDALTVPSEAVQSDNNQNYVLVKTSTNQLNKKTVKTGIETDTSIEILEGISENDQIVIKQK